MNRTPKIKSSISKLTRSGQQIRSGPKSVISSSFLCPTSRDTNTLPTESDSSPQWNREFVEMAKKRKQKENESEDSFQLVGRRSVDMMTTLVNATAVETEIQSPPTPPTPPLHHPNLLMNKSISSLYSSLISSIS
jgi:hypothetical protein